MDVTADVVAPLQVVQGDMLRPALQAAMGLRNAEHFRKAYLASAIEADYLGAIAVWLSARLTVAKVVEDE